MLIDQNNPSGQTSFDDEFGANDFDANGNLIIRDSANPNAYWAAVPSWDPTNSGQGDDGWSYWNYPNNAWFANPDYLNAPEYNSAPYNNYTSPFIHNPSGGLTMKLIPSPNFYTPPASENYGETYNVEGGLLSTAQNAAVRGGANLPGGFSQLFGYFEVDASIPIGSGYWPSFWLFADSGSQNEIDVMESYGSTANQNNMTVHDSNLPIWENHNMESSSVGVSDGALHKFGVDWEPDRITFYLDRTAVAWMPTPVDMTSTKMHMLLTMATDPNSTLSSTGDFNITYVKSWASPAASTTSIQAITTPNQIDPIGSGVVRVNISAAGNTFTTNGTGDSFYLAAPSDDMQVINGFTKLDTLDLSAVLNPTTYNYLTSDPIKQGWISFASDGAGGTWVDFTDKLGNGQLYQLADLKGVDPNNTTFTLHGAGLTIQSTSPPPPPPGTEQIIAPTSPVALTAAYSWTGGVVLSNGNVAAITAQSNGAGWVQGVEYTYSDGGTETNHVNMMAGGSSLQPIITAFPIGGFYEVSYPTSDPSNGGHYEIYNANDTGVFFHNQYTSQTGVFSPLYNGGYVTTDPGGASPTQAGVFDANNVNVAWITPSNAPGTPTVNALVGGGFLFTYVGSNAYDVYNDSGTLVSQGNFGATASTMATGFGALSNNGVNAGFVEVWLSPDGGQQNAPTTMELQAFNASGAAATPIQVTQDLDPWHTEFHVQGHSDGSAAIVWSGSGAVYGAEYTNGAVGAVYSAGTLGITLDNTETIEMPNDQVGFAWFENGDAWAEIFNPANGAVEKADLGPSSSTALSTLHALATAQGGIAVSWHETSAIEGAVLGANGQVGALAGLAGDLIGVTGAGHAVALYDNGSGTPMMQTYALNDGLFWTA